MSNEIENKLDAIEKNLLKAVADIEKTPFGAYNIRENGKAFLEIPPLILILLQSRTSLVLILL